MSSFFGFPKTPHVLWLASGDPRDDKLMTPEEREDLLAGPVVIEEKVDGANVGFSVSADGVLLVQNRGAYLARDECDIQFKPLFRWLDSRKRDLVDMLGENLILLGEWCYAVHSILYDRLPDWFLAFDVYDRESGRFWSTRRRNELMELLDIATVPRVAAGSYNLDELRSMLDSQPSALRDGPLEGLYIRREDADWLLMRAKIVRPSFTQAIEEHWSRRPLTCNRLVTGQQWV